MIFEEQMAIQSCTEMFEDFQSPLLLFTVIVSGNLQHCAVPFDTPWGVPYGLRPTCLTSLYVVTFRAYLINPNKSDIGI